MNYVHYYESHVTIEPVFNERLINLKKLCERHGFRVADLLMKKSRIDPGTPNQCDTFCTGRDTNYDNLFVRMKSLCIDIQNNEYHVMRSKIECVVFDTKCGDVL